MTKLICCLLGVFASIFTVAVAVLTTAAPPAPGIDTIEENKEDVSAPSQESDSEQKDNYEPIQCYDIDPLTSNVPISTVFHRLADDPKVLENAESSLDDLESIECSSSVRYVSNTEELAENQDVRRCNFGQETVIKTNCTCSCSKTIGGGTTATTSQSMDANIGKNTNGSGKQNVGAVIYGGVYVGKQIINVNVFNGRISLCILLFILMGIFFENCYCRFR